MPENTFVSYAQNREDVVLWRALQDVRDGRYVEVGANHPRNDSITRAFYDRGWSGVTVEPVPAFADLHRAERPRDTQVEAAVTSRPDATVTLHVVDGTGLSTLVDSIGADHASVGLAVTEVEVRAATLDSVLDESLPVEAPIHFMVVDVEGAEREVLESIDLRHRRPWVLVVEATAPSNGRTDVHTVRRTHDEWEALVTGAGYTFCQFDGLSRFYVADEHADLRDTLSIPAGPLDFFTTDELVTLRSEIERLKGVRDDLERQAIHWRATAFARWSEALAAVAAAGVAPAPVADDGAARAELAAMRRTVSWRVTRPLRLARRVAGRAKRALR
ncbi:FkbM family methyltransferase [Cellulomonas sp. GbtcB1]|uniref:FkbM family methyltransferase n=1 Tax=Cellulomonas sp. GbtcB1 TaxID=2824746 RepID=UPI001C30EF54|nr:FkbM family methyltransferase [Cellulomonas sp. GbtcB1]